MSKKALVVDDSSTIRQVVSLALRESGFDIIEGANGKEALDRLGAETVSIVVTDLNMPVMDGYEFIKQLRRQPSNRFTPVLVLTTESHHTEMQRARDAGASGWVSKPIKTNRLMEIIQRVAH